MAGHPTRLAAGLAGERCQAASAVQDLGAAGIAGGGSGMEGKVMFLRFLFFLSFLIICALLAAVILEPTVAQDSNDTEEDHCS